MLGQSPFSLVYYAQLHYSLAKSNFSFSCEAPIREQHIGIILNKKAS